MSSFRRYSTRWLAIWLPVLISITAPPALFAQIEGVQATSGEIIIKARNGESYRVSEPALDEKSIRVSPDRQKVVYHTTFAGYGLEPRLTVKLWSLVRPGGPTEFRVSTYSRYIDTTEWMEGPYVFFAGDRQGVIVDSERGGVTHKLWGGWFSLSPDRRKIVYIKGAGRVPREYVSDVASVAVLGNGIPPSLGYLGLEAGVNEVYPPASDPTRGTPAPIPERRHTFLSEFLWFSDSQRVVLVEEQDGTAWLVVLALRLGGSEISAASDRFQLPVSPGKVEKLDWLSQDAVLRLVIDEKPLVVDLAKRTVRP